MTDCDATALQTDGQQRAQTARQVDSMQAIHLSTDEVIADRQKGQPISRELRLATHPTASYLQPHWVCILPPLDCTYSAMGCSKRSAGDPLSMRSTEASVFVAKNWKMDSMHLAEIYRETSRQQWGCSS